MVSAWTPAVGPYGVLLPAGMPTESASASDERLRGLELSGVTLLVHPAGSVFRGVLLAVPYAVVFVYNGPPKLRDQPVVAFVPQPDSTLHGGSTWLPRPSRVRLGDGEAASAPGTGAAFDPFALDGDHVRIRFLNDDTAQAYVAGALPHPFADAGRGAGGLGARTTPNASDGSLLTPRFTAFQGAWFGLDTNGDLVVDLQEAYAGDAKPDGTLPADPAAPRPGYPAESGNVIIRPKASGALTIAWPSGRRITLTDSDGRLVLGADQVDVGTDAGERGVLGDKWTAARAALHNDVSNSTGLRKHLADLVTAVAAVPPVTGADATSVATSATTSLVALGQAISDFATRAKAAIDDFEAQSESFLSASVRVKE